MIEPELIEIIEGPTPEFHPSMQNWLQSLHESPEVNEVVMCQLRTGTGEDIKDRCENAWDERRPVFLDFPDEWGMRQQLPVVAMRLSEIDEGEMLTLWVSIPYEPNEEHEDDDNGLFSFDD